MPGIYTKIRLHTDYLRLLIGGIGLFCISMVVNLYAIHFATEHASNYVTDVILSNTPVFDVDVLFVYGTFFATAISAGIALYRPSRLPFVLYAVALFLLIRAGFTTVTHVGPFPDRIVDGFGTTISHSFFGADRFFSGHAGLPFLGALSFWHKPLIRYFFLTTSAAFSIIVLLGHLHYTIDVLSAFFITYAIHHIAIYLFPGAYTLFLSENSGEKKA